MKPGIQIPHNPMVRSTSGEEAGKPKNACPPQMKYPVPNPKNPIAKGRNADWPNRNTVMKLTLSWRQHAGAITKHVAIATKGEVRANSLGVTAIRYCAREKMRGQASTASVMPGLRWRAASAPTPIGAGWSACCGKKQGRD